MAGKLRLGVNIDHVATLRQARYATMPDSPNTEPSILRAAGAAERGGAATITVHLRADRRHIQDRDVEQLRGAVSTKLNLEMGNTPEILEVALAARPDFVCLVPENRQEITTEGGLDAAANRAALRPTVKMLQAAGIAVSLFIDPEPAQIGAAAELGAEMIELHTGTFANAAPGHAREAEVVALAEAAELASASGLQVNAGHGINTENLPALFAVPHLAELNVGHHLVSRALSVGLETAVAEMVGAMERYNA
jgi:pyridoxine 5-phosphate synthase